MKLFYEYVESIRTIKDELNRLVRDKEIPKEVRREAMEARTHFRYELKHLKTCDREDYAVAMINRYNPKILEFYSRF
ncbi:UPF0147 family protein, partial [Candidatus Pacearchaeota archaeon]|nr:UPF0147 family protein [Candidatus Pacearchaeota archaeon]